MANKNQNQNQKQEPKNEQFDLDEVERWNPTQDAFDAYQAQDYAFAVENVMSVLRSRMTPISMRELKDSTLHVPSTVERVMSIYCATGAVIENKGKFSLAQV